MEDGVVGGMGNMILSGKGCTLKLLCHLVLNDQINSTSLILKKSTGIVLVRMHFYTGQRTWLNK